MYCTSCGKELPDGVLFCPYCGSKIKAPGNYYDQSQTNPYYQPKKKGLSPAIIIALCLIVLIFIISIGVAFFIVISYRNRTSTGGSNSAVDVTNDILEDSSDDVSGSSSESGGASDSASYYNFICDK